MNCEFLFCAKKREAQKSQAKKGVGTPYFNLYGFSTKGCRLIVENMM